MVLWRLRSKLSLRDLTEMFLARGFELIHETVREWEERFAPVFAETLKAKCKGEARKKWHTDETYLKVKGQWCYLYRAIDQCGNLVDMRLSETRDLKAAEACEGLSPRFGKESHNASRSATSDDSFPVSARALVCSTHVY